MPHRIDKFLPYAGYLFIGETVSFTRFIPLRGRLYTVFYKISFSPFNQTRMRKRILCQKSSIALYPFVLVRILSAMIARCPWRINWSHLALAINLARVRRASGSCPRACVTAWCNVVVGVLVDYRLSSTISAPEVLVRPHIEMTVVDRMGAYGFLYIGRSRTRARISSGRSIGALVVVRDGIRLIHIFAVLSIQFRVPVWSHLNRNLIALYFCKVK